MASRFEKECYAALDRLKQAAKEGSNKRITREAVCAEAGKSSGAIRPVRHQELCEKIEQTEEDRKTGILGVKEEEQVQFRETVVAQKELIEKLKQENEQLEGKIEKQAGVMLNLLHELNESEQELEIYKDRLEKTDNRIKILMETIKPKGI